MRQTLKSAFTAHRLAFSIKAFGIDERYGEAGAGIFCTAPQIVRADAGRKVSGITGIVCAVRTAHNVGVIHGSVSQFLVNQHKVQLGKQVRGIFDNACYFAHAARGSAIRALACERAGGVRIEAASVCGASYTFDAGNGFV